MQGQPSRYDWFNRRYRYEGGGDSKGIEMRFGPIFKLTAMAGLCALLGGCMSEQLAEQLQVQREKAALAAWRECLKPLRDHHRVTLPIAK